MSELWKTLTFVAVALVLTGAAVVSTRDRRVISETFNDQGQAFFPDFQDPLECTDLEVVDFEPSTATASRFRVKFQNNRWVIPSHYDYPADARDRLSKTAAAVMDLTKDTIRSDRAEDHEEMGVIDPLDTKLTTLQGRGKRITLRDPSERVLADFIIGNEIKDRSGQRYVRVPGQKRTYGVRIQAEPSTRFADWIETNLLKLEPSRIRKVEFDNYKVNLEQGYQRGEVLTIRRKDSSDPWTMEELDAGSELNTEKLRALTDALADLKIVGVRPKPAGLTADLKGDQGIKLSTSSIASLQSKGFYMTRDGQLLSNQGDVRVFTDEGVVYTIRFGEVVFGSADELSAGTPEEDEAKEAAGASSESKSKKSEGTTENRYVMVTVSFDESLIPKPAEAGDKKEKDEKTPAASEPLEIPVNPFAPDPNDPAEIAKAKEAKEKAEREQADYEKKLADGRKRVKELTERFAAWYYVVPGDAFRSINLDRAALVRPKKKEDKTPGASGETTSGGSLPEELPPIQP